MLSLGFLCKLCSLCADESLGSANTKAAILLPVLVLLSSCQSCAPGKLAELGEARQERGCQPSDLDTSL